MIRKSYDNLVTFCKTCSPPLRGLYRYSCCNLICSQSMPHRPATQPNSLLEGHIARSPVGPYATLPMPRRGRGNPHRVRRSYPSESAARRTRPLIPSSPGQQALDGADDSTETGISKAVSRSRSPVTVRVGSPSVWKDYSSSGGTDAPLPFTTGGVGETESSRFTGASFDSSQAAQTRCGTVRRGRPQTALPTHPPRRFFLPCCRHLSLVCR